MKLEAWCTDLRTGWVQPDGGLLGLDLLGEGNVGGWPAIPTLNWGGSGQSGPGLVGEGLCEVGGGRTGPNQAGWLPQCRS